MVSVVVLLLLDVLDLLLQLLDRLLLLLDLQRLLLDLLLVPPLLLLHLPTQPLVLLHQEDISVPGEIVVVESDVCCCFCCCCCSGGVDGDVARSETSPGEGARSLLSMSGRFFQFAMLTPKSCRREWASVPISCTVRVW